MFMIQPYTGLTAFSAAADGQMIQEDALLQTADEVTQLLRLMILGSASQKRNNCHGSQKLEAGFWRASHSSLEIE